MQNSSYVHEVELTYVIKTCTNSCCYCRLMVMKTRRRKGTTLTLTRLKSSRHFPKEKSSSPLQSSQSGIYSRTWRPLETWVISNWRRFLKQLVSCCNDTVQCIDWLIDWLNNPVTNTLISIYFALNLLLYHFVSIFIYIWFILFLTYSYLQLSPLISSYTYIHTHPRSNLLHTVLSILFFILYIDTNIYNFILIRVTHSYSFFFNFRCEKRKENELGVFRRFLGRIVW